MRGFFGRQRVDKPPVSQEFDSYDVAIYPSRAYRCYAVEPGLQPDTNTVMLPSIDADTICKPLGKDNRTPNPNQRKPTLREYELCFIPPSTSSSLNSQVPSVEALNTFHYPELWTAKDNNCLAHLAALVGLPAELQAINVGRQRTLDTPEKARIRFAPRCRPPRPTRRGAKVSVSGGKEQLATAAPQQKRPRDVTLEGDDLEHSDTDSDGGVGVTFDDDDEGNSDGFESDNNEMTM